VNNDQGGKKVWRGLGSVISKGIAQDLSDQWCF
jgi:hypothetical protein